MAGVQWSNLGVGGRIGESPILLFSCQPARDGERLYLKVGIGHDLRYGWSVGVRTHWSNVEIGGELPYLRFSLSPISQPGIGDVIP